MSFTAHGIIGPTQESSSGLPQRNSELREIIDTQFCINGDFKFVIRYDESTFPFDDRSSTLVICKASTRIYSAYSLNFRRIAWNPASIKDKTNSHVEAAFPLESRHPEFHSTFFKDDKRSSRRYEFVLDEDLVMRSFVAIDYEVPCIDGGWYYTVDLAAFAIQACGQVDGNVSS